MFFFSFDGKELSLWEVYDHMSHEYKCTAPPRFKSLRLEFGCLFRLFTMPTSHSKVGLSFLYSLFASFAS